MPTPETPVTNKTSEAVHELTLWLDSMEPKMVNPKMRAVVGKYQRYENYARKQAESGDMEASEVLGFDPLA